MIKCFNGSRAFASTIQFYLVPSDTLWFGEMLLCPCDTCHIIVTSSTSCSIHILIVFISLHEDLHSVPYCHPLKLSNRVVRKLKPSEIVVKTFARILFCFVRYCWCHCCCCYCCCCNYYHRQMFEHSRKCDVKNCLSTHLQKYA